MTHLSYQTHYYQVQLSDNCVTSDIFAGLTVEFVCKIVSKSSNHRPTHQIECLAIKRKNVVVIHDMHFMLFLF